MSPNPPRSSARGKPFLFTNMKAGQGIDAIIAFIVQAGMLTDTRHR